MNRNIIYKSHSILNSEHIKNLDFESIDIRFNYKSNNFCDVYITEPPVNTISLDFKIKSGVYVNCFELAYKLSNEYSVKSVYQYTGKFTIEFGV